MRLFLTCLLLSLLSTPCSAQDRTEARCRRIRHSAESSAYLLFSPTIWAEGVHVPVLGDETGLGYVQGGEWQVRASLSTSAVDIARGVVSLDAADAECAQIEALARAQRILELGDGIGQLPSRRAERAALVDAEDEIARIAAAAETRLREGLATETELAGLRAEISRLSRRIEQLDGEIDRLVLAGHDEVDVTTLRAALLEYEHAAMTLEQTRSTLRRMSAWTVQLRAGVVPTGTVDWYGQLQVGINIGAIAQQLAEDAVLEAREDELRESDDELRAHVDRLEEGLGASVRSLRGEREHVARQIEIGERQLALLAQVQSADVDHQRAMTMLALVSLRAEDARLGALIEARAQFEREEGPES